eukprot:UN13719
MLNGADPVEYFNIDSSANYVDGSDEYVSSIYGVNWRFKSEENKDLFDATPGGYVPQYGGYCAWGMRFGKSFGAKPHLWSVYDNKLYMNLNDEVQVKWVNDVVAGIEIADGKWEEKKFDNPTIATQ